MLPISINNVVRSLTSTTAILILFLFSLVTSYPSPPLSLHDLPSLARTYTQEQESLQSDAQWNSNISSSLFAELEELSRIVDISYCVGTTGITHPFLCASRCGEFPDFELVDTFNTGPLMSDSCGYVVLDHGKERVIVAFRGTYSIANTIVDLSTVPQEYVPYPEDPDNGQDVDAIDKTGKQKGIIDNLLEMLPSFWTAQRVEIRQEVKKEKDRRRKLEEARCTNCTVHTGFWTSWQNTRPFILPHLESIRKSQPTYKLHLVGHSLGGAVAGLAGLEFNSLGWEPIVTTFGEPRIGNKGMRDFIDASFDLPSEHSKPAFTLTGDKGERYRRITHIDDPVPLLPLQEWGYRPHAGEVYISKAALQPGVEDVRSCFGDEDVNCLAAAETDESWFESARHIGKVDVAYLDTATSEPAEATEGDARLKRRWNLPSIPIPARYKMWQLFFAHRDYFWRLGLCVPGGDPYDWNRDKYHFGDDDGDEY